MPSPLFNLLGNQMPGNVANMMQQFEQFRSTFQGDPRQQVQQLLSTGRMTQDQFNRFSQMASELQKYMR